MHAASLVCRPRQAGSCQLSGVGRPADVNALHCPCVLACVCVCCRACLVFSVMSLYVECRGIRARTFSVTVSTLREAHTTLVARGANYSLHDHIVGTRHDTPRRTSAQSAQRSHQFSARPSVRVPPHEHTTTNSTLPRTALPLAVLYLEREEARSACSRRRSLAFGWPRFRAPRKSRAIASASR